MQKNSEGFTLIELMVVISIIGLLSSIVLASLKDARDKANVVKFSSEINQFKSALELYRGVKGEYPYENTFKVNKFYNNGSSFVESYTDPYFVGPVQYPSNPESTLSALISDYMKNLPQVPKNSYTPTTILGLGSGLGGEIQLISNTEAWAYITNSNTLASPIYRCVGDVSVPKYVIIFHSSNPQIFNHYSYLPHSEIYTESPFSITGGGSITIGGASLGGAYNWTTNTLSRCFSLK